MLAALRASINPKEQKKKNGKKKKKESLFSGGVAWAVKVFWKKILPHQLWIGLLTIGECGGDFFSKMHFNLADHERGH